MSEEYSNTASVPPALTAEENVGPISPSPTYGSEILASDQEGDKAAPLPGNSPKIEANSGSASPSQQQNRSAYEKEKERERTAEIEGLFFKPAPESGVKYKSKEMGMPIQKVYYREGDEPIGDISFAGVAFKVTGHVFYFMVPKFKIYLQQMVMVETNFGLVMARIVQLPEHISEVRLEGPAKQIVRPAYHHDFNHLEEVQKKVRYSLQYFKERVFAMGLDLKPIHVEYINNSRKAIFYFTAPERVDFRELVKDLLKELRVRIELRQIGVRDETKILGAIGPCGQTLCCSSFLRDYEPLSVKMARDQGLAVNSDKINGVCGRLKCCLAYEMPVYEELGKDLPEPSIEVMFEGQRHQVLSRNVFDRTVTLRSLDGDFKVLDFKEEYKWENQKIVSKNLATPLSSAENKIVSKNEIKGESRAENKNDHKPEIKPDNRNEKAPTVILPVQAKQPVNGAAAANDNAGRVVIKEKGSSLAPASAPAPRQQSGSSDRSVNTQSKNGSSGSSSTQGQSRRNRNEGRGSRNSGNRGRS